MYTILINNDDSVLGVEKQRIMQRSKLVNTLRIVVPKIYNPGTIDELDMSQLDLLLEYVLPVSHELKIETMVLSKEPYKEGYLTYLLPFDTSLTAENGNVEMKMSFVGNIMKPDGTVEQKVRPVDPYVLTVIPVQNWFVVPDKALDTLTQHYLANQQAIKALEDLTGALNNNKADDINMDIVENTIYLTSNGKPIGTPIKLADLGQELGEKTPDGIIKMNT